ncbi:hypothetical protein [Aureimonas sp. SK2]|nr:hypothetical protein [Aureimonas sp. SK2]
MSELLGTAWALPAAGIVLAVVGYSWLHIASRKLDRKYGSGR